MRLPPVAAVTVGAAARGATTGCGAPTTGGRCAAGAGAEAAAGATGAAAGRCAGRAVAGGRAAAGRRGACGAGAGGGFRPTDSGTPGCGKAGDADDCAQPAAGLIPTNTSKSKMAIDFRGSLMRQAI